MSFDKKHFLIEEKLEFSTFVTVVEKLGKKISFYLKIFNGFL